MAEDSGQKSEDGKRKSECGSRPPAHRGLRLRPGGISERKGKKGETKTFKRPELKNVSTHGGEPEERGLPATIEDALACINNSIKEVGMV